MTEKTFEKSQGKGPYFCEINREKVANVKPGHKDYMHCGRKMTSMEVFYMSSPSPSGA